MHGDGVTSAPPVPLARRESVRASALGGLLLVVFALGACRTIYVGDSGELVTAVHLLGIPHPSGYPLYVLLGKLWAVAVPFGSVALRMSLFSAACAAGACGVLYLLCRGMDLSPTASALAALLLAFGDSFWSQANIQRVYSLNALLLLLTLLAAWRWERSRGDRTLAVAFLLCGLGASNHLFMAVVAPCLTAFALLREPSLARRWRPLALSAGGFLLGLLPYAYLPLRSRADPRLDWGDPETLGGFLEVLLRRDFWERAWIESPADLLAVAGDYLRSFVSELAWGGAALAGLGLVAGWRTGRFVLLPISVMAANVVVLALHGSRVDLLLWHRYYIPSYAMAALLAGMGCHALLRRMPRRLGPIWLLLPMALLMNGWRAHDRSRYRVAEDFSTTVLRSLPPGAHLSATDDNILFTLMYLHLVERMRPDVNLILQGVGSAHLPPLRFNPDVDPVFFTHHPNWSLPDLDLVPVGLVFRAWRAGRPPPEPALPAPHLDGELDPRVPKDYLTRNLIGHFHYMRGVTFEKRDWPGAREEFRRATAAAPDNDVLFYNLGLIYRRNGLLGDALEAFRRSHTINPRHLASHDRPRASDKIGEVEAEQERIERLEAALRTDPALRRLEAGSSAYHLGLAELLEGRGERRAARGHRLRALEVRAAGARPPDEGGR